MDAFIQTLADLISSVGFPIAAFLLMFFQNRETTKAVTELRQTLAENTLAIQELRDEIKEIKNDN